MLAALLTVLLLTQTLCITAFAENPVEVLIPQGSGDKRDPDGGTDSGCD